MGTCIVDGCDKAGVARRWCDKHYSSWRYRTKLARPRTPVSCSVAGCLDKHQGKGLCNRHYQRALRAEATQAREANGLGRKRSVCAIGGCESFVKGHSLCATHYQRAKIRDELSNLPRCARANCDLPVVAKGLCNKHYSALSRSNSGIAARPPSDHPGKYFGPNGYVTILRKGHPNAGPSGHVFEHRFVMSEYIGRPLETHETVHHKNGDRSDNRLDNLELWSCAQPRGQRVEDKLQWCREFLAAYEPKHST